MLCAWDTVNDRKIMQPLKVTLEQLQKFPLKTSVVTWLTLWWPVKIGQLNRQ